MASNNYFSTNFYADHLVDKKTRGTFNRRNSRKNNVYSLYFHLYFF